MKKQLTILFVLACCCISTVFAQTNFKTIKGKIVSDATNGALPSASIKLSGSTKGTTSDADGNFTIKVPDDGKAYKLVVSYTGYATQTIAIGKDNTINIRLKEEIKDASAEEVIVTSYYTVKKKDVLASISSVGAKDLKDIPLNSAEEALNGRLAGVTANTAEGSPDADVRLRVRGGYSISQDNSPLYVVDGVIVDNGLRNVVLQDIQTIDVLKDAASTAIYGARGANGVIVITTKSGKIGKPKLSYNMFVGIKKLPKMLDVMSPYDFILNEYERVKGNAADSSSFGKLYGSYWDTLNVYKNVNVINWQDIMFGQTGFSQTHNVNVNGGTKQTLYNFSYTFNNDKAIVRNSGYQRHQLNAKVDQRIGEKIKFTLSTRYTNQKVFGVGVSDDKGTSFNRLRNSVKYRPFLRPGESLDTEDADPNTGNGLALINPLKLTNAEYKQKITNTFALSLSGSYAITKNLTFKSVFGFNKSTLLVRGLEDSITGLAIANEHLPVGELDTTKKWSVTNSNVLSYSLKNYKKKHDLDILIGEETLIDHTENFFNTYYDIPKYTTPNIFITDPTIATRTSPRVYQPAEFTLASFFSRTQYSFLKKYFFQFNFRADGSSKFAPDRRWGYFGSASVAWRITNEGFMQKQKVFDDMKLRLQYGNIGNNRIGDYLYLNTFGTTFPGSTQTVLYGVNNTSTIGYVPQSLPNPFLIWESAVNRGIGLDFSILNKRVEFNLDYFQNNSKDLLYNVNIAPTSGYKTQVQNIGKTSVKGFEATINATIVRNKTFSWTANFNIATSKVIIDQLGKNQTSILPGASWSPAGVSDYIVKVGAPIGSMYGLVTDGFYKVSDFDFNATNQTYTLKAGVVNDSAILGASLVQPGAIKFKDLNGDKKIDLNNDRTIIGNPNPKFTGGFGQQFTYKNFDMSIFINFSYGLDVYNANKIEFTNGYTNNSNLLNVMKNRWTTLNSNGETVKDPTALAALNANATIWKPISGTAGVFMPHSWAIEDGSFVRLNNVTIGYNFTVKALAKLRLSKLRLYLTGNNLAVITRYTGYDPEVSVSKSPLTPNLDYSAYPKSRSYIFGLNVTF